MGARSLRGALLLTELRGTSRPSVELCAAACCLQDSSTSTTPGRESYLVLPEELQALDGSFNSGGECDELLRGFSVSEALAASSGGGNSLAGSLPGEEEGSQAGSQLDAQLDAQLGAEHERQEALSDGESGAGGAPHGGDESMSEGESESYASGEEDSDDESMDEIDFEAVARVAAGCVGLDGPASGVPLHYAPPEPAVSLEAEDETGDVGIQLSEPPSPRALSSLRPRLGLRAPAAYSEEGPQKPRTPSPRRLMPEPAASAQSEEEPAKKKSRSGRSGRRKTKAEREAIYRRRAGLDFRECTA